MNTLYLIWYFQSMHKICHHWCGLELDSNINCQFGLWGVSLKLVCTIKVAWSWFFFFYKYVCMKERAELITEWGFFFKVSGSKIGNCIRGWVFQIFQKFCFREFEKTTQFRVKLTQCFHIHYFNFKSMPISHYCSAWLFFINKCSDWSMEDV